MGLIWKVTTEQKLEGDKKCAVPRKDSVAEACLNDFPWNRKGLCGFGAEKAMGESSER